MSVDEDGVRASRVRVDSLKAIGVMRGKNSVRLAGITTRNPHCGFQTSGMQDTSCPAPSRKGRPVAGLRALHAATKPRTRSHGQCLPALSRFTGRCLAITVDAWGFGIT
jgi:hypothetical protein